MAHDPKLADRIRELLGGQSDLTERKMFGGLAFRIGGHMAVAASGQGGILVRVDPARSDALVAGTRARPMKMRGRRMQGWRRVDPEALRTSRQLARWVELGTTYARSLPAKGGAPLIDRLGQHRAKRARPEPGPPGRLTRPFRPARGVASRIALALRAEASEPSCRGP